MIPTFKAMKAPINHQWMSRWTDVMVRQIQARSRQQANALLEQGRLAQGQRMRRQRDFMASIQRGRGVRNQQFQEGQFQKQKDKEDYVDYILDCQRTSNDRIRIAVGNCPSGETN